MSTSVKVYKVTLPSYYAWPTKNIILNVSYTEEDAKKFVESYPNLLLRPWLKIEVDIVPVHETD